MEIQQTAGHFIPNGAKRPNRVTMETTPKLKLSDQSALFQMNYARQI
jgi:hypothetical protein